MGARVAFVVAAAVFLTRGMSSGAGAVLLVIACANVTSPLILALLFRRTLRRIVP
jgi:hypothetical protein